MPKSLHLLSAALVALAVPASGADSLPTVDLSPYLVGQAPANLGYDRASALANLTNAPQASTPAPAVEHQSSLNGTLYAVVAPTYDSGNTLSYLRLFNGASATSTFTVTMVGAPSGTTYGTANIRVPPSASLQYIVAGSGNSIQTMAGAGNLTNGDTSYSLYIQDSDMTTGYAHVTFNGVNNFFENNSVCTTLLGQQIASVSNSVVLINVDSSVLANWPATITIHNFWNAPVTDKVTMIDAATGAVVGNQIQVTTQANSTYSVPESQLETMMGFKPSSSQTQVNIFITDITGAPPYVLAGQTIVNNTYSASFNMSPACAVNAVQNTSSGGIGGGLNGY